MPDLPACPPEAQGIDSAALVALLDYVRDEAINLHSLLIARRGNVVAEIHWHPYHPASQQDVRSIGKSITAILTGIALAEGHLSGLDLPVLSFFPERTLSDPNPRRAAITIRHLLTMTSGIALTDADTGRVFESADGVGVVLNAPMAAAPGERFEYSSSNYLLLAAILQRVTGRTLFDYARETLFGPLGITDIRWQADRSGITLGWGGVWITARDMAKIGQLYLNGGVWDGRQIVPADWVAASTRAQVIDSYGFGWWSDSAAGLFEARGFRKQRITVVPARGLVIALTAGMGGSSAHTLRDHYILPAIRSDDPLPPNPDGAAALAARIMALAHPAPQPVPPLPEIARHIAGRTIRFEDNPFGVTGLALAFGDSPAATLDAGGDRAVIPLALDGLLRPERIARIGPFGTDDLMAMDARWDGDHTLILRLYAVNNPEYWAIRLAFDGDRVRVRWADVVNDFAAEFEGMY